MNVAHFEVFEFSERCFFLIYCKIFTVKNRLYSTVEIEIREFSTTNTFACAYVCLQRYVFNSIAVESRELLSTVSESQLVLEQ